MSKKLIIMVCIAAMIMTNIPNWDAGADVSGTPWSEAGDTLVGNATVWKDEVITLSGNLTINETGSLTLDNVTLLMNCITNGSYYIEVQPGGEMYILNNSNITSVNENAHYNFWVRNDSKFEMRDSELHGCGYEWGENGDHSGLWINTNNVTLDNNTLSGNLIGAFFYQSENSSVTNCTVYNNYRGIYLDHSSNNNISANYVYNNSDAGIFLWDSSNNNIISNCLIYNNSCYGIYLDKSINNTITNCAIYNHSDYGVVLSSSSNNNTITNCTVYNNSYAGIYFDYSSDNTVTNSSICSNGYYGVAVGFSSNNVITSCNISDNALGIYLAASDNHEIVDNVLSNNGATGIYIQSSNNTVVDNNVITNVTVSNTGIGIHLFSSKSNIITKNTINLTTGHGIFLENSSDNVMVSNTVNLADMYGIYLNSSINNQIANSTITNSTNYDFYLAQNSQLISLNTTFNKTSVYFSDLNSTLNVSWYLNMNVLWNNSIPAEYADVRIQDNENDTFDINRTTDKDGWIKNIEIQEYIQHNQTNKTFFTPHNVTASQGNISIWNDTVTVDETKTIELVLDHNAPEINYTTISPEQEYTIDENTTVEFKFNVSHPDNLTLTYRWYLNNTDTFNETEVKNGTLENTSTIQKINWTYYFNYTSHGNYTIKVEVFDGNANVSYTWVLTVNDVNGKPEIEFYYPPKNIILGNNSCVIFNVTASDPDNDVLSYQWTSNGAPVSNENKYIFYAEYNASENGTNTYLIEVIVTDVTDEKLSVNHTWTVTVVDLDTLYADLLNQTELLEELTELINKISYVCANLNQSNLDELNMTLHGFYEKYNVLLNQTGLLGNIKILMEQIEDLTEQFDESENNAANLSSLLDELNITLDQLNVNLTTKWDALNFTIEEKNDAENAKTDAENERDDAIEAKNKAEYKLGASVVCAVIGGIIAGFFVSFLLRRKLPKKGKT